MANTLIILCHQNSNLEITSNNNIAQFLVLPMSKKKNQLRLDMPAENQVISFFKKKAFFEKP